MARLPQDIDDPWYRENDRHIPERRWRPFDRSYPGFDPAACQAMCRQGRLRPRPEAKRSSSRHPRKPDGRTYWLTIGLDGRQLLAAGRRVRWSEGIRLVNWLRSRGHLAALY